MENKIILAIVAVAVIGFLVFGLMGVGVYFFLFTGIDDDTPPDRSPMQNKYECSLQGIELVGYNTVPMTIDDARMIEVRFGERGAVCDATSEPNEMAACEVGDDPKFMLTYGAGKCYAEEI